MERAQTGSCSRRASGFIPEGASCVNSTRFAQTRFVLCSLILTLLVGSTAWAQKVKVEYDKKNDFNRFKTYSWAPKDQYLHPMLAAPVIGAVDANLQEKGLKKPDS